MVGAHYHNDTGHFHLACNATYDPLSFTIGGQQYNLPSAILTMDVGLESGECLFGVKSHHTSADYAWVYVVCACRWR